MKITLEEGAIETWPVEGYFFYYLNGDGPIRVLLIEEEGRSEAPAVLMPGQGIDSRTRFNRVEVSNLHDSAQSIEIDIRRSRFVDNRTDNKLKVTTEPGEPLEVLAQTGEGAFKVSRAYRHSNFRLITDGDGQAMLAVVNPSGSEKIVYLSEIWIREITARAVSTSFTGGARKQMAMCAGELDESAYNPSSVQSYNLFNYAHGPSSAFITSQLVGVGVNLGDLSSAPVDDYQNLMLDHYEVETEVVGTTKNLMDWRYKNYKMPIMLPPGSFIAMLGPTDSGAVTAAEEMQWDMRFFELPISEAV